MSLKKQNHNFEDSQDSQNIQNYSIIYENPLIIYIMLLMIIVGFWTFVGYLTYEAYKFIF